MHTLLDLKFVIGYLKRREIKIRMGVIYLSGDRYDDDGRGALDSISAKATIDATSTIALNTWLGVSSFAPQDVI